MEKGEISSFLAEGVSFRAKRKYRGTRGWVKIIPIFPYYVLLYFLTDYLLHHLYDILLNNHSKI
ncbi:MAG: hypothetical protein Q8S84_00585 [bacterium]|nr:hypothetical protein [bacterium]MDP3380084.1 hypothetical protein [bacterium]